MSWEKDEVVAHRAWDGSLFKRLLGFARPHVGLFARCFGVLGTLFALELASAWIWKRAIDGPATAAQLAPEGSDLTPYQNEMLTWIGVFLGLVVLKLIMRYFEVATVTRTGQAVIHDLRTTLFRHMQRLDLAFFDRRPTGALVTRVTSDVENLSELFTGGIVNLAFDLIRVAVVLAVLFALHSGLAWVVLLMTPVLIGISIAFRGGARRAHRTVRAELSRLNGYLQEVLQGVRVVQVFRREPRVSATFAEHLERYFTANKKTILLFALFFPAMALAVYLIQGATLGIGVVAIGGETLTFGNFMAFWLLLNMLVRPIRELGERYNILQSAFASAERIFQVLDTEALVAPVDDVQSLVTDRGAPHVRFEKVAFGYDQERQVIHGVDFEIPPGETVALVGATGSGKSTLVNLLLRYYDPTKGRITLDGIDLRELDPGALRSRFGLVLQEDFLFAGTVRENLVMERDEVTDESLESALETSRADKMLANLPGGLDAKVAERGATFSTGERQLLAITRALAGGPDVIILDEATASVDSATEAQIEAATGVLLEQRSSLVVAHRLSTIRRANMILVLDAGKIVERGTHEELLEAGGVYARLHALQFEDV
tara:strand:+ start:27647 stop:29455 length:1809 start_codon:yes stop_codon:yes gene_type:complete